MSKRPTAVVLSGGGANGAYEVGILKALIEGASPATDYQPLEVEIFTGTSVGAYNASFLAAQAAVSLSDGITSLEQTWRHRIADTAMNCGNGVSYLRGVPFQLADPGCVLNPIDAAGKFGSGVAFLSDFYFKKGVEFFKSSRSLQSRLVNLVDVGAFISESPLLDLVPDTVDFDLLRRSPALLSIAATNWWDGTLRLIGKEELVTGLGADSILASAAIPGVFPPVVIDGIPFVDGAVLMNTPLTPAIQEGAETLHVLFVDPEVEDVRAAQLPSTVDTLYRLLVILYGLQLRGNILDVKRINDGLNILEEPELQQPSRQDVRGFLRVAKRVLEHILEAKPYRELTIHQYSPKTDLGGGAGLLDFSGPRLDRLIEMGFQDAVQHDCDTAGCINVRGRN